MVRRLPEWLRKGGSKKRATTQLGTKLRSSIPNSICEEAKCPNRSECFAKGVLTFMILGTTCTRNCGFCSVAHGQPLPPQESDFTNVISAIKTLDLQYVVLTSPNRDDLSDGGASHYARMVSLIHETYPHVRVEVLIPDFQGNVAHLKTVIDSQPEVLNHNLETVPELYTTVRRGSLYNRSLNLLEAVKELSPTMITKTGVMVGLGETMDELKAVFKDIQSRSVDVLTLGQYLKPDKQSLEVDRFYHPDEFEMLKAYAQEAGIPYVFAGPLVRSSYMADVVFDDLKGQGVRELLAR